MGVIVNRLEAMEMNFPVFLGFVEPSTAETR